MVFASEFGVVGDDVVGRLRRDIATMRWGFRLAEARDKVGIVSGW